MDAPAPGALSEYLTVTQAAAYLRCSTETIRRRVNAGEVPEVRLDQRTRLLRISDLDALRLRNGWGR